MTSTATEPRASPEEASRDIVRHFIFLATWAVSHADVQVEEKVTCPGLGRTLFDGYTFTFNRARIRTNVDGTAVFVKRNMFAGEVELDLKPEQKQALFTACADALVRQRQEKVRLQRDEAECAEERERSKREREYAQLAMAVSGRKREREE